MRSQPFARGVVGCMHGIPSCRPCCLFSRHCTPLDCIHMLPDDRLDYEKDGVCTLVAVLSSSTHISPIASKSPPRVAPLIPRDSQQ